MKECICLPTVSWTPPFANYWVYSLYIYKVLTCTNLSLRPLAALIFNCLIQPLQGNNSGRTLTTCKPFHGPSTFYPPPPKTVLWSNLQQTISYISYQPFRTLTCSKLSLSSTSCKPFHVLTFCTPFPANYYCKPLCPRFSSLSCLAFRRRLKSRQQRALACVASTWVMQK